MKEGFSEEEALAAVHLSQGDALRLEIFKEKEVPVVLAKVLSAFNLSGSAGIPDKVEELVEFAKEFRSNRQERRQVLAALLEMFLVVLRDAVLLQSEEGEPLLPMKLVGEEIRALSQSYSGEALFELL